MLITIELPKRSDMQSFVAKFGFPLLTRELIQKSTHKRIYVVRVVYATALYAAALYSYRRWSGQLPDSFRVLGEGLPLFETLVNWQYAAIYLFLPLITCGTITSEKERQTLMLLKLTKLGPWTILIEKLASRLLEFSTFLLLSLPLGAVAYGLGGVETGDLVNSAYQLAVTSILVGCFSLFMSTWFRTTAGAMIGTYLIGTAIRFGGPPAVRLLLLGALRLGAQVSWLGVDAQAEATIDESIRQYLDVQGIPSTKPQGFFPSSSDQTITFWQSPITPAPPAVPPIVTLEETAIASIPMLAGAFILLMLARICLWRRAESLPQHLLRTWFITLDSIFRALNHNRLTRGITFGNAGGDLPTSQPIRWYELRRRLIGRAPNLLRILLAIEISLIAWFAWCARFHPNDLVDGLEGVWKWGWLLAALGIAAISTGVVAIERSRQTLDVLLATPLTSREIVSEKMAGGWRWIVAISIPLLTVLVLQVASRVCFQSNEYVTTSMQIRIETTDDGYADVAAISFRGSLTMLVLRRTAAILCYLPLLGWLGFQFGLRLKSQWRAVLFLLLTLVAVCSTTSILDRILAIRGSMAGADLFAGTAAWLKWLDPRYVALGNAEFDVTETDVIVDSDILPPEWFPFLFHFLIVGGMLWGVRRNAFRSFSRFVGRLDPAVRRSIPITGAESIPAFAGVQIPVAPGQVQLFDAEPTNSSPGTKND
ncbi:MAG: hypothetical protein JSS49_19550 [Planctomycetes bacterium]|nr:hypothetical protein [Planctomycetota bacterium]